MKKLFAVFMCAVMTISMSACSKKSETGKGAENIARISPETLLSAETVSGMTGASMVMSEDGVSVDGNGLSVTYVANPIGTADTVSVTVEQFSDTLGVSQVWSDYESNRITRSSDTEFVEGIGEDCYIAYPFINVYVRGCYVRISAGSGNNDSQKNLLMSLAANAAVTIEQQIPAEAVDTGADNAIK